MYWITFLLGLILFLPNYATALEDRLKTEQKFRPLQIFKNINKSTKTSKPLSYIGLLLCTAGIILYMCNTSTIQLTQSDKLKATSAFIVIWGAILCGSLRENMLISGNAPEKFNIMVLFTSSNSAWRHSILSASKNMSCIIALVLVCILIKKYLNFE